MNKNLEELQNIASKNWLYFYVNKIIAFVLLLMYIVITSMLLTSNTVESAILSFIIVVVLGIDFVFLNPVEWLHRFKNKSTWKWKIILPFILNFIEPMIIFFFSLKCVAFSITIKIMVLIIFSLSTYQSNKTSPLKGECIKRIKANSDIEETEKILKKELNTRVKFRNGLFKIEWAILAIILVPSIIGVAQIYSEEIKKVVSLADIGEIVLLIVLALIVMFATAPQLFEISKELQYLFVPKANILLFGLNTLKEQDRE